MPAAIRSLTVDINGRPYGYAYQPSSLDPTNVAGGQAQPLPDDFLRPYQGLGRIQQREFAGYSDYHALQFSVNRRRSSDGLSFGAAYTYQLSNKSLGAIDPFVDDNRARNYTSNGRRPHVLVLNYSYERAEPEPEVGQPPRQGGLRQLAVLGRDDVHDRHLWRVHLQLRQRADRRVLRHRGDQWRRRPGESASRVVFTCDPNLPRGERTFERQFRTECVAPPTDQFRLGTALNDEYLGPGYMNWDISVFKHVPLGGARRLQFRVELYNAFNTDQWTGGQHQRELRLHHRRVDQCEHVRPVDRRHQQRASHPARREVHVLIRNVSRAQKGKAPDFDPAPPRLALRLRLPTCALRLSSSSPSPRQFPCS